MIDQLNRYRSKYSGIFLSYKYDQWTQKLEMKVNYENVFAPDVKNELTGLLLIGEMVKL